MLHKYHNIQSLSDALLNSTPNPLYWRTLFHNSKLIITQIALSDQREVAPLLGMSQSKLSQITAILKEYAASEIDSTKQA